MNNERLLSRFLRYIDCPSESKNEREFCLLMEEELKKLGLEVWRDEIGDRFGSNGFNLHAFLPGEGEPVLFSCHMDTVTPGVGIKPVIENGVIRSDGTTILGSDDKSGIAAILEAVETIIEEKVPHRPIEVMFSICEELGLLGARNADYSRVRSKQALVLDSGTVGAIIHKAPAMLRIKVEVTGKPAHAGVAPEQGIHALKAAAEAIAEIPCGHVDDISVMNVSGFSCPGPTNIVPAKANFAMEIRSFDEETLQRHLANAKASLDAACARYGASYDMQISRDSNVLNVPEDHPFLQQVYDAFEKIGISPVMEPTFGGCDATWLSANGLIALNTGTGMTGVHSVGESLAIADLETTARLVYAIAAL